MKIIYQIVMLLLGFSITALAQPRREYSFCKGLAQGASITGQSPNYTYDNSCYNSSSSGASFTIYGFSVSNEFKSNEAQIVIVPCSYNTNNCEVMYAGSSYTYGLNLPSGTGYMTIGYASKRITFYRNSNPYGNNNNNNTCNTYGYSNTLFNITVNYTDRRLQWTWDPAPHRHICKSVIYFDLNGKINNSSGVTYYLDGSATPINGSNLNASLLNVGQHTITAKKHYDNGDDIAETTFNVYDTPRFDPLPGSFGACSGEDATLSVSGLTGGGTYGYRWQQLVSGVWGDCDNAGNYSGVRTANFIMVVPTDLVTNYRKYRVKVRNECTDEQGVVSGESSLAISGGPRLDSPPLANVRACPGTVARFNLGEVGLRGSYAVDRRTKYYQWLYRAPGGDYVSVPGAGSSGQLSFSVPSTPGACNGYEFKCVVKDVCANSNPNSPNKIESRAALLTVPGRVTITKHPESVFVCPDSTVQFEAGGVYGSENISAARAWEKAPGPGMAFAPIPNEHSGLLSVSNVLRSNSGERFRCRISDACGTVNSLYTNEAVLTVYGLITASVSSVPSGFQSCDGMPFSCTASVASQNPRNRGFRYQWAYKSPDEADFTPCGEGYEGGNTNRLSFNPAIRGHANYQYKCTVSDDCGNRNGRRVTTDLQSDTKMTTDAFTLTVNPIPSAPTAADVRICGLGDLTARAASPGSVAPVFKWYSNERDLTPVATGNSYTASNLTRDTTFYYAEVTDKGCTSPRRQVLYLYFAKKPVPFANKTLCSTQASYNMESELTDEVSKGGSFSWASRDRTSLYSGSIFNPARFEVQDEPYVITYRPIASAKSPPHCYTDTDFNITVVGNGGSHGITIDPERAPDKTINLCVGDAPFDLYSVITPKTGQWFSSNSGTVDFDNSALNKTSNAAVYTALSNNVTTTEPVQVEYRVMANGCTVSDKLKIFIKRNGSVPVMSGIPDNICPGQKFTVTSTIQDSGDTERYGFEYSDPNGDPNAYVSLSNNNPFEYSVERDYQIAVVSIDNTYRCKSAVVKKWIRTPFGSGVINVSSQVVNAGESVAYTFNGLSNSTFAWDFGDGERGNIQNPIKYYHKPGDFKTKLRVTSSLGCSKDFELPVAVAGAEPQVVTALPEAMPSIYPNPVQSVLHIEGGGKIELFNALGQVQPFAPHENGIDMSAFASGIYVLIIGENHYRIIKN